MARLIAALVRHGNYHQLHNTPSAWQPFPLNEQGKQDARNAVPDIKKILQEKNWSVSPVCDSSNLLRAWQTASIMCEKMSEPGCDQSKGYEITVEGFDELSERGVGSAANLSIEQIEAVIQEDPRYMALPQNWKSNSHFQLPFQGAESLMGAGERVAAHLHKRMNELALQVSQDTVKIFVGHGASFRHAAHVLGVLSFEQIALLSMYHAQPVFIEYDPDEDRWIHVAGQWKIRKAKTQYKD